MVVAVLHNKNKQNKGAFPEEISHYFFGKELDDRLRLLPLIYK
jgi:hypothetical protein